jgi:hypothetical protein
VRRHAALLGTLVLAAAPCVAAGEFTFAGFSRATTMDELKTRFPTSSFADNYVYVSDADARDHVYGVQIPGRNPSAPPRLTFERPAERTKSRRPEYPACATLESAVKRAYGAASRVRDFMEEQSRNHELTWERDGEILTLACFRMGKGAYLAEALSIWAKEAR